ncbi:TetR/AcrR family transcriptional regulator [Allostreptomyces psammosilenae]|uniref:AcrR family transcriptional regulator n=1 Tax=Allostreptomyces psammosilenae TaxID=1892865 RepID=A0A852ZQF7_9ACTN|nr:TetR/AcrR family transcriptional regulator [Allostreptomyces psammosilenae]NYI03104.1 AcrR family transcriptional regulator [Allostreptomyces psammosilenae]
MSAAAPSPGPPPTAPRGRPRSESARRAVLESALRLCQQEGYQHLTIKGIADAAGVGRQTVYRWWPAKTDVLLEALRALAEVEEARLRPDTGDTLTDVERLLDATFTLTRGTTGHALVGLMADAQADGELAEKLQGTVIGPRRDALRAILERGVSRGELAPRMPLDLAVDFAFGTMWYRLLSRHAPVDGALARQITEVLRTMLSVER